MDVESGSTGACLSRAMFLFFFVQAEDGIRDRLVTGVQTCALPIYRFLLHKRDYFICAINMEDTVFSPEEWQTAEIPSSLNPNSIDQVEDREMAGWNKRRTKVTGSFT